MGVNTTKIGRAGEQFASSYLAPKGYKLLTKNFLCHEGEIDLIMLKRFTIHYIEVKTWNLPFEEIGHSITLAKQNRIKNSALTFIERNSLHEFDISFDIFFIKNIQMKKVFHLMNAF